MRRITKVIPIRLPLSNCFLVLGEKNFLVDSGFPGDENAIVDAIHKAGLTPYDITCIVHTHGHIDHCGSSAYLMQKYNIPSAIYHLDEKMVMTGHNDNVRPARFSGYVIKYLIGKRFPPFFPDYLLEHEGPLIQLGINASLLHTPGHTMGSSSIILDNNEAIVGDVFMGGHIGGLFMSAEPRYHYFVKDRGSLHMSIQKLLDTGVQKFYLGHGGPVSRLSLQLWFDGVQK